jgi:hypothetical protein
MKQSKSIRILAFVLTILMFTACASKPPVSQWSSDDFSGSVDNILIIGVSSNADRRYTFENSFVDALAANNTKAISSRTLLPSSLNLRRDIVEKAIEGKQLGAVLLTRVAAVKEKETYHLPSGYDYQSAGDGYYDIALQETNKGYYASERLLILETLLYDTASGDLIWTMHSGTAVDGKSEEEIIKQQIQLTIKNLASSGLIGSKP